MINPLVDDFAYIDLPVQGNFLVKCARTTTREFSSITIPRYTNQALSRLGTALWLGLGLGLGPELGLEFRAGVVAALLAEAEQKVARSRKTNIPLRIYRIIVSKPLPHRYCYS